MVRAVHTYDIAFILAFIEEKGLTQREIAEACGVSEKHIGDVLNARTSTAKTKTKKKFYDGFKKLGLEEDNTKKLFR